MANESQQDEVKYAEDSSRCQYRWIYVVKAGGETVSAVSLYLDINVKEKMEQK